MGYDAERATLKAEFENYLGMKSAELEYTIVADAWGLHLQDTLRVGPGFPIITCLCVCITLKEQLQNIAIKSHHVGEPLRLHLFMLLYQDAPSFHAGRQRAKDVSWR